MCHKDSKMPFSTDQKTNDLAAATVESAHDIFGKHTGFRTLHAKGILTSGTFTPSGDAKSLSKAPHFQSPVPIVVRFSNSTGIPQIPDTDANSDPRGFAVRFFLGNDRKHTDIVAHSTPFFPVSNAADFLAFLQAVKGGTAPDFIGAHPETLAFVQAPKPTPKSFTTQAYYGVNAFKLINAEGKETYVRYRFLPDAGVQTYNREEVDGKSADFLQDELKENLKTSSASFSFMVQVAEEGDSTNDGSIHWPETRRQVKLGTITLDKVVDDSAELQRAIIFDPIPRVDGVDVSDDPLLDYRASVYLISGKERRAAGGYHPERLPKFVPDPAQVVT